MNPLAGGGANDALWGSLAVPWAGFWIWLNSWMPGLAEENGPMENFQVCCLGIGMLGLSGALWHCQERARRIVFCGFILLYGTIMVREVDVRPWHNPTLNFFFSGRVRDLWVFACWVAGGVLFFRQPKAVWRAFGGWFRGSARALLLLAAALWLGGALMDKANWAGKQFTEELFEVAAAWLMLVVAGRTYLMERTARSGRLTSP